MSKVALLLLVLALVACGASTHVVETPTWERPGLAGAVRPEMGSPQPNEPAPDFELPKTGGGTLRLSSMRGSWVLVHFTATWCPYCDAEIAHLGEIANAYASRNLRVVVIDLQEEHDRWLAYSKERLSPAVIAVEDHSGETAMRYAPPRAQPSFTNRAQVAFDSTLLVDPSGVIRLFLLPDTAHFDPKFGGVRGEIDRLVGPPDVVTIDARARAAVIEVRLEIADGYHIMSDHPSDPYSIPTTISVTGISAGPTVYPASVDYQVSDKTLSTFSGALVTTIPFTTESHDLEAQVIVRYQACTASRCLAPVTRTIPLHVTH